MNTDTKTYKNTGRTALILGRVERIFETYVETGVFAGATYELLESELPTQWATEAEAREQWERETLPLTMGQSYFHPGGCSNCGGEQCYMLCPNHPFYYSPEDEMRDEDEGRYERRYFG